MKKWWEPFGTVRARLYLEQSHFMADRQSEDLPQFSQGKTRVGRNTANGLCPRTFPISRNMEADCFSIDIFKKINLHYLRPMDIDNRSLGNCFFLLLSIYATAENVWRGGGIKLKKLKLLK
jgi:hypothetical protein